MKSLRSPLESELHHIRIQIVVIVNVAFLLYALVTTLAGPAQDSLSVYGLFTGLHSTKYWAALLALSALVLIRVFPDRVKTVYTPYLVSLLVVAIMEVRSLIANNEGPFHLSLWLTANMAIVFLVYGARLGLLVFSVMLGAIILALLVSQPPLGYALADWLTTLIVMGVSGASSFMLISLIERNMLVNERTIEELRTARIDAVTGVYGRASTEEELVQHLAHAHVQGTSLSVIMCDIDHFKAVNDAYGHKLGDEVLRSFAERLRQPVSDLGGLLGRWGGEEFLAILPHHSYAQANAVAERLRRLVSEHPLAGVNITASFGVASTLDLNTTPGMLFGHADHALYEAKRAGRNTVR